MENNNSNTLLNHSSNAPSISPYSNAFSRPDTTKSNKPDSAVDPSFCIEKSRISFLQISPSLNLEQAGAGWTEIQQEIEYDVGVVGVKRKNALAFNSYEEFDVERLSFSKFIRENDEPSNAITELLKSMEKTYKEYFIFEDKLEGSADVFVEPLFSVWDENIYTSLAGAAICRNCRVPNMPISTYDCAALNPKKRTETVQHLQQLADETALQKYCNSFNHASIYSLLFSLIRSTTFNLFKTILMSYECIARNSQDVYVSRSLYPSSASIKKFLSQHAGPVGILQNFPIEQGYLPFSSTEYNWLPLVFFSSTDVYDNAVLQKCLYVLDGFLGFLLRDTPSEGDAHHLLARKKIIEHIQEWLLGFYAAIIRSCPFIIHKYLLLGLFSIKNFASYQWYANFIQFPNNSYLQEGTIACESLLVADNCHILPDTSGKTKTLLKGVLGWSKHTEDYFMWILTLLIRSLSEKVCKMTDWEIPTETFYFALDIDEEGYLLFFSRINVEDYAIFAFNSCFDSTTASKDHSSKALENAWVAALDKIKALCALLQYGVVCSHVLFPFTAQSEKRHLATLLAEMMMFSVQFIDARFQTQRWVLPSGITAMLQNDIDELQLSSLTTLLSEEATLQYLPSFSFTTISHDSAWMVLAVILAAPTAMQLLELFVTDSSTNKYLRGWAPLQRKTMANLPSSKTARLEGPKICILGSSRFQIDKQDFTLEQWMIDQASRTQGEVALRQRILKNDVVNKYIPPLLYKLALDKGYPFAGVVIFEFLKVEFLRDERDACLEHRHSAEIALLLLRKHPDLLCDVMIFIDRLSVGNFWLENEILQMMFELKITAYSAMEIELIIHWVQKMQLADSKAKLQLNLLAQKHLHRIFRCFQFEEALPEALPSPSESGGDEEAAVAPPLPPPTFAATPIFPTAPTSLLAFTPTFLPTPSFANNRPEKGAMSALFLSSSALPAAGNFKNEGKSSGLKEKTSRSPASAFLPCPTSVPYERKRLILAFLLKFLQSWSQKEALYMEHLHPFLPPFAQYEMSHISLWFMKELMKCDIVYSTHKAYALEDDRWLPRYIQREKLFFWLRENENTPVSTPFQSSQETYRICRWISYELNILRSLTKLSEWLNPLISECQDFSFHVLIWMSWAFLIMHDHVSEKIALPTFSFAPLKLLTRTIKLLFEAQAWRMGICLIYHVLPAAWLATAETSRESDLVFLFAYLFTALDDPLLTANAIPFHFFPLKWMLPVIESLKQRDYSSKGYGRGVFLGYTLATMMLVVYKFFNKEQMLAFVSDVSVASLQECVKFSKTLFHERPRKIVLSNVVLGTLEGFHRLINLAEIYEPENYSFSYYFKKLGYWFQFPSFDTSVISAAPMFSLTVIHSIIYGYMTFLNSGKPEIPTYPVENALIMLCELLANSHELKMLSHFIFPLLIRVFLQFRISAAAFGIPRTASKETSFLSVYLFTVLTKERKLVGRAGTAISQFLTFQSQSLAFREFWAFLPPEAEQTVKEMFLAFVKLFDFLSTVNKKSPPDEAKMRTLLTVEATETFQRTVEKVFTLATIASKTEEGEAAASTPFPAPFYSSVAYREAAAALRFFPRISPLEKGWNAVIKKFLQPLGPASYKTYEASFLAFSPSIVGIASDVSEKESVTLTNDASGQRPFWREEGLTNETLPFVLPSTALVYTPFAPHPPPAVLSLFRGPEYLRTCTAAEPIYEICIEEMISCVVNWIEQMQAFRGKIKELDILNSSVYVESKVTEESHFECTSCGAKNPAIFILNKTTKDERVKDCIIATSGELRALFSMGDCVPLMEAYFLIMENLTFLCKNVEKIRLAERLTALLDRFITEDLSLWGIYFLASTISASGSTAEYSLEPYGGQEGILNMKQHPIFDLFDSILFYIAQNLFLTNFEGAKVFIQLITRPHQPLVGVAPVMRAFAPSRYPHKFIEMYRSCLRPKETNVTHLAVLEKFDVKHWIKEMLDPAVVKEFVTLLSSMGNVSQKVESSSGSETLRRHFTEVYHNSGKFSMETVLENALLLKTDLFGSSLDKSMQKFILESLQSTTSVALNVSTPTFMNAFIKLPNWINQKVVNQDMDQDSWDLLCVVVDNLIKPHPNKAAMGEKMEVDFVMAFFTLVFQHFPLNWKDSDSIACSQRFVCLLGNYLRQCRSESQISLFQRFFVMLLPSLLSSGSWQKEISVSGFDARELNPATITERLLLFELFLSGMPLDCGALNIKECIPSLETLDLLHLLSALVFFIRWIGISKNVSIFWENNENDTMPTTYNTATDTDDTNINSQDHNTDNNKNDEGEGHDKNDDSDNNNKNNAVASRLPTVWDFLKFEAIITFIENRMTLDLWKDVLTTPDQKEKYLQLLVFLPLLGHSKPLSTSMETFLLRWLHLSPFTPFVAESLFEAHVLKLIENQSDEGERWRVVSVRDAAFSRWISTLSAVLMFPNNLNPFLERNAFLGRLSQKKKQATGR